MTRAHHAFQMEEQVAEPTEQRDDTSLAEWHLLEDVVSSQNKAGEIPVTLQVFPTQPDLKMGQDTDEAHLRDADSVLYEATRFLLSACRNVAPMRQAATLQQTEMEYAMAEYQHAQSRVRDSQQALFDEMTVALRTLRDQKVESMDLLDKLYGTMMDEIAALELKAKSLADRGVAASRAESALAVQDEKLVQSSREVLKVLNSSKSFAADDVLSEEVPGITFDEMPAEVINGSALAHYYSSKADAEIMAEREQSLNFDYQEELAVRTFRQDHDEVLTITDEDFERAYRADFENARKVYEEALATLKAAYETCQALGIVVEEQTNDPVTTPEPLNDGIASEAPLPFALWAQEALPRVYSQPLLSRRTSTPTLFSAVAGTVLSDPNPRTRSKADTAHKKASIEHWIRDTSIASQGELEGAADSHLSSENTAEQAITVSRNESSEQEAALDNNDCAPATPKAIGFLEGPAVARAVTPDSDGASESPQALQAVVA